MREVYEKEERVWSARRKLSAMREVYEKEERFWSARRKHQDVRRKFCSAK